MYLYYLLLFYSIIYLFIYLFIIIIYYKFISELKISSRISSNIAMRLWHARDCNPCPSPHARLPPAPLVRRGIVHGLLNDSI